ncbi:Leu/Phe-tRNA-protein transferase [Rhodoblastus acidophilus]|uniref:Leu/Phe-tRNA-protein transferase n=1 Tax=Rhodoblastus acidophilus TaxID=1074 RepID=A0A212RHB2_RHOAC|nr:hypothetical protein [Rhodoblastus acidophilus]PPQ39576.1 hypothetical protein CKO16_04865 [Rhodoblastus acidophilus]RAI24359.1 hypothetical protein CH337_00245 [Rhodoblastus acidophilus]SNB71655.1 Leu/Phe-tRNA-protein transferase [Rhodoblastus acidophilus]
MSDLHLQEIARLPLDQRAAHIAQLFAEGISEAPPAPAAAKQTDLGRFARRIAYWMRPDRLPLALRALAAMAGRKFLHTVPASRPRADGFCGVAPIPNGEAAMDFYAQGLCFDALPGFVALWSPPWRAIVRPAASLRLPDAGAADAGETRFDRDFVRLLDLCEAQATGAGRKPACPAALKELYAHGLAHCVEWRAGGDTRAALVGVVVGGVFTVEGFFANDRADLGQAVAALARRLAALNFAALDFRGPSPQLRGLPIELTSRENFVALLTQPSAVRAGRWRNPETPTQQQAAA